VDIVIGNHLGPNSGGIITVWRNWNDYEHRSNNGNTSP
jgi:hypothetical protein